MTPKKKNGVVGSRKKHLQQTPKGLNLLAVHRKETWNQVKLFDKVRFTYGISLVLLFQWCWLQNPHFFPLWFWVKLFLLIGMKYALYRRLKFQVYMVDFCYAVCFSLYLQLNLFPDDLRWFKMNYVMANGPLLVALVLWRNSLVFHSFDRLSSFSLHFGPALLCHQVRWRSYNAPLVIPAADTVMKWIDVKSALMFYLYWQLFYLFVTEVVLRKKIRRDKAMQTSLRYFLSKEDHFVRVITHKTFVKLGLICPNEAPDPNRTSSKLFYAMMQLLYTLFSIGLCPVLWYSYTASWVVLSCSMLVGIFNGASYYFDQFSRKYRLKFVEDDDSSGSDDRFILKI